MSTLLGALCVLGSAFPVAVAGGRVASAAPGVVHVDPAGSNANPGTVAAPVRTLGRAVSLAATGSSIVLHAGTYHESVHIFGKDLDIAAAPGEAVVFDGARPVEGWIPSGDGWYSPNWTASFPRTVGTPVLPSAPMAAYPDLAFRNGATLRQVATLAELAPGTFFVDDAQNRLWVGDDPRNALVEASDLPWALWFNRAHGSSLRGVTVRRYATPAADMAAVRLYSNNLTMADCTVGRNAYKGVSVIGSDIRLERLTERDNAYIGIHGHTSARVAVVRATVVRNNAEGFDAVHSGSGIKFTTSSIVAVRNSYVADNDGVGIWTDLGTAWVSVTGNLVERNSYSGILMELSGQTVVADNVVLDSGEAGIWILETNDAYVWNNAVYRNDRNIWVEEGPRTDPSANGTVNWDLNRVSIRNNVIGPASAGSEAQIAVDDWTERRSAVDMAVTSNSNAYWLPSPTTTRLARWARWPASLAFASTLDIHRFKTGQDGSSTWSGGSTNPFARDMQGYDLRVPVGGPNGEGLPRRVANSLGLAVGAQIPIGPRRVMLPPTNRPGVVFR